MPISYPDFHKPDIRTGTIISAEVAEGLRVKAYRMEIELGPELGRKVSLAQITDLYNVAELIGRQVMCVVNLEPKRMGRYVSEVLTLGVDDDQGRVVLLTPERPVPNGNRLY